MIGQYKKRITLTLPEQQTDMLEKISKDTGLTKSKIMKQLLFAYAFDFWINPEPEIERWKRIAKKDEER